MEELRERFAIQALSRANNFQFGIRNRLKIRLLLFGGTCLGIGLKGPSMNGLGIKRASYHGIGVN